MVKYVGAAQFDERFNFRQFVTYLCIDSGKGRHVALFKVGFGIISILPAQVYVKTKQLAGENVLKILTAAPGNNAPIGGIKVIAENGWFAARPSGTEDIYKIYAESFLSKDHLKQITREAQLMVNAALA